MNRNVRRGKLSWPSRVQITIRAFAWRKPRSEINSDINICPLPRLNFWGQWQMWGHGRRWQFVPHFCSQSPEKNVRSGLIFYPIFSIFNFFPNLFRLSNYSLSSKDFTGSYQRPSRRGDGNSSAQGAVKSKGQRQKYFVIIMTLWSPLQSRIWSKG